MASTSENAKKTFVLRTSDGHTFELEEAAARMSETIKNMIEDDCAADVIPLPNVDAATLTKVAEFCKRHTVKVNADDNQQEKEELTKFDEKFIDDVKDNQQVLFDLILAANYLSIKELLDLTCQCVADMIKGKTPEEIRAHFHIKNDYTPELEAEVRRENAWAFE